jgi:hypothetical protein
MVGIFHPACELLPPWTKDKYLCTVAPLPSLLPPPLPKLNVQYIQTVCGCGGRVEVFSCVVDHILLEFYAMFLTRFRTYKITSPPRTKMTSKDDIYGLVSLKFLRPWSDLLSLHNPTTTLKSEKQIRSKLYISVSYTLDALHTRTYIK